MKQKDNPKHEKKSTRAPQEHTPQPNPFTPGLTKAMVRQHAFELYRDKLAHEPLTLEDWVLAEKDLVHEMETNNLPK
jgi:hypothetical protein